MELNNIQYTDQLPDSQSLTGSFMDAAEMSAYSTNFINNKVKQASLAPELAKLESKGIDSSKFKDLLNQHINILQGNPVSQSDYNNYINLKSDWDKLSANIGTKSLDQIYDDYARPLRQEYQQIATNEANNYGFGSKVARFAGGLIGNLADPVHLAETALPLGWVKGSSAIWQAMQVSAINATLAGITEPFDYKTQKQVNTTLGLETPSLGQSELSAIEGGAAVGAGFSLAGSLLGKLLRGKSPIEQTKILADKVQELKESGKTLTPEQETALSDAHNIVDTLNSDRTKLPSAEDLNVYIKTAKDLGLIKDHLKSDQDLYQYTDQFKEDQLKEQPTDSNFITKDNLKDNSQDLLNQYKEILGPDLDTALKESKEVEFDYLNKDGSISHRIVQPHHLGILGEDEAMHGLQQANLSDNLENSPEWRNFKLKNISNLKVVDRTFEKSPDYSPITSKFKEIHQTVGETGEQEANELNQFIQLAKKDKSDLPSQDVHGNLKDTKVADIARDLDQSTKAVDTIKSCMGVR